MRTSSFIALVSVVFLGSCSHLKNIDETSQRTPAAANSVCTDPPCTDIFGGAAPSTNAHWTAGLRNNNVDNFGLAGTMVLALTFDDGPGDGTRQILDLLDQYKIEAAYFHIGKNAKAHPILFAMDHQVRADGRQHIIGNHSYTHPDLDAGLYLKNNEALYRQLVTTDHILRDQMGESEFYAQSNGVVYFRAPMGSWSPLDAQILRKKAKQYGTTANDLRHYYGPIYWTIGGEITCDNPKPGAKNSSEKCDGQPLTDAADWDCWDNKMTPARCAEGYYNKIISTKGGVVLSHEIYKNTAAMWTLLLPKLQAAGFKFERLDKIEAISRVKLPKALPF